MKNISPLLEDTMRVLYTLKKEGYMDIQVMEYILGNKYNVNKILYCDDSMTCYQDKKETRIDI